MRMENWILRHPKLHQMKNYELGNPSQMYAAIHTYLDLTEVRLWSEVNLHQCSALRAVYFTAREKEAGPIHLVMPLSSTENVSMERFATIHAALRLSEGERSSEEGEGERSSEEGELKEGLTVALVDTDSAILYYHVTGGIQPPRGTS